MDVQVSLLIARQEQDHGPLHENILMPYDRVRDAIRLIRGRAVREEVVAGDDGAGELEGELGGGEEALGGADVVEEAGDVVGGGIVGPGGEVGADEGGAWGEKWSGVVELFEGCVRVRGWRHTVNVDAPAVVVGVLIEFFL